MKNYVLVIGASVFMSVPAFAQAPAPAPSAAAPIPVAAVPAKAAPDIQQQIDVGSAEYKQKNFGKAAEALDAASVQLRKMKSESLSQFFPAAPKGWAVKEGSKSSRNRQSIYGGSEA